MVLGMARRDTVHRSCAALPAGHPLIHRWIGCLVRGSRATEHLRGSINISDFSPQEGKNLKAKLFDGIAPDVVNAEHAWWYPEADPPDYRWKESCVNLLFGDDHIDPDTGAEPLKCYRCRVARV